MVEAIQEVENDSPSPKKQRQFFNPDLEIKLAPISVDPLQEIKDRIDKLETKFDDFSQNLLDSKLGFKNVVQTCTARTNSSLLESSHLDILNHKLDCLEQKIKPKITLHSTMASDWQVALEHPSQKIFKQLL